MSGFEASARAGYALLERELVRFFRQPNRIIGAIGQPVIFWVLLGAAFRGSFRAPGVEETYGQFFLPGVAVMITLFTAIFSTISVIEDRREGFLQGVLVSPIGRFSLVLGKILGGTVLAVLQSALFLLLAPTVGIPLSATAFSGCGGGARPRRLRPHGARLLDRVADGLDAGVPRDHERLPAAALDALRLRVPRVGRLLMAGRGDGREPAHVRRQRPCAGLSGAPRRRGSLRRSRWG